MPPLSNQELKALTAKLLLKAQRFRSWKGIPPPEDLVQEVLLDLYSGRRTLTGDGSLFEECSGILWDNVRAHYRLWKRRGIPASIDDPDNEALTDTLGVFDETIDDEMDRHTFCQKAAARVKDIALLASMVALLCQDPFLKSQELADRLGVDVNDIYNASRRLRRHLRSLKKT